MALNIEVYERPERREKDCQRIVEILRIQGYNVTSDEACVLWESYSRLSSANWLTMANYTDEVIFKCLKRVAYFEGLDYSDTEVIIVTRESK